jgi:anaerobic magnesium-protoporphyrin IX monomethyl ester cyclase
MKIALAKVSSYQNWYKMPSIALGYLAAGLEANGVEVKIFDGRYFNIQDDRLTQEICDFNPDMVGFSAMTHEIRRVGTIAQKVKQKRTIPVIVGGCHLTALPAETMEEFPVIDYGVLGEGESTVLDVIKVISGDKKIEDIEGIIYRRRGEIAQNKLRNPIAELDLLPFPAYQHYYKYSENLARKKLSYSILSSRGCPFSCVFCMRVLGQAVRVRSIENIISEMDMAITNYGASFFNFADEILLFNNERVKNLLTMFIKKGYPGKIKWSGLTRANFVNEEIISLAKKAGCASLEMGVESGSDDILKRIKKNITVAQVKSAVGIIKKYGIKLSTYYILGHPGENENTVRETMDLAVSLNTTTIAVGLMVPYPGTMVYQWANGNKYGYKLLSKDWSRYDKYGGSALEIEGFTLSRLEDLQKKAYLWFFLKNLRFLDLFKFILSRHKGILSVLLRRHD